MPPKIIHLLLICATILLSLTTCQKESESLQEQLTANSTAKAAEHIPLGQWTNG